MGFFSRLFGSVGRGADLPTSRSSVLDDALDARARDYHAVQPDTRRQWQYLNVALQQRTVPVKQRRPAGAFRLLGPAFSYGGILVIVLIVFGAGLTVVGGLLVLLGESMLYHSPSMLGLALLFGIILYLNAMWVEEPELRVRFSAAYEEYLKLRPDDEIARRERLWENAIDEIEFDTGRLVPSMHSPEFRRLLGERLDLRTFEPR